MFKIDINAPKVNLNSIEPELSFDCTLSYDQPLEAITSLYGFLYSGDGKELATLSFQNIRLRCPLRISHFNGVKKNIREENIKFTAKAKLSPTLPIACVSTSGI